MRILQIVNYYYPNVGFGGPVQCTYYLSKYMVEKGHEVTVYTTDASDKDSKARMKERFQVIDGARVFFFPSLSEHYGLFVDPGLLRTLRSTINDFDVVHLHEYRTFQNVVFYYSRRNHVPYVLSPHGELQYNYKQRLDVSFLRSLYGYLFGKNLVLHADRLVALTEVESLQFAKLGVEKHRIEVIPNAIDETIFLNPPPRGHFRESFGLGEEQIILYLGRISKGKGIDNLVAAFFAMRQKKNLKLVLAGPDYGFLPYLKNMVSDLNLKDNVLFTSTLNRQDVVAAYNDAAIVVYATQQEGFPLVPLEAGAMGKPTIVSNHPSVDFVRKGEFGLSVDYGNSLQLKGALETILEDTTLAKKLGQNGRKYVLENFSWNVIGRKIESMYDQIARHSN